MNLLNEKDLEQLQAKGITKEQVEAQIRIFEQGIPFVQLQEAAVIAKGIRRFTAEEEKELQGFFDEKSKGLALLKFVPASGAASRMFKALFAFLDAYNPHKEALADYWDRTGDDAMKTFVEGIERFPFYEQVQERILDQVTSADHGVYLFIKELLTEEGLNFGFYPKGLLPFHAYEKVATPFVEHLKEAAYYAKSEGKAALHFTISPQHEVLFKAEEEKFALAIGKQTDCQFEIGYSFQKSSTDTLAVDMENKPFRNNDGSILFRPGGHGALIQNLNEVEADLVFIKNIDNVVTEEKLQVVGDNKKMLAGLLLQLQEKIFHFAAQLEAGPISENQMEEIVTFFGKATQYSFPN